MLQKTLFISLFICLFHNIIAQDKYKQETSIGIKQGVNISRLVFVPVTPQKLSFGYSGGIVFRHIEEPHLGIQIELNFSQKGWSESLDSGNFYSRKVSYIELPLITHFEVGSVKSKTNFTLDIGSALSYMVHEKEKSGMGNSGTYKKYYDQKIENNFDFSICFGIGIIKKTAVGNFEVGCRVTRSLTNIFKLKNNFDVISSSYQVISVDLKYMIEIN